MARSNNDRSLQFFLILANLPESVLRQNSNENWKPVKDLIYSHIHSDDREYGRIDILEGIAVCRMHDLDQRREAYDALQGLSWRNVTLRAWLCEKHGHVMEQTAGPIDRRTGNVIPAPGYLVHMSSAPARRVGCAPWSQSLPRPPFPPQYGIAFGSPFSVDLRSGFPYACPPQAYSTNPHSLQIAHHQPELTPPFSYTSRTSSSSTISASFLPEAAHPRFRDGPSLPRAPLISQAASSTGRASGSGSSLTLVTSCRPSSTRSNQFIVHGHSLGTSGYNKIKIQNFSSGVSIERLQRFLERDNQLYIVETRSYKVNGRASHVFITFHSDSDAEIAVQQLKGIEWCGSKLSVSLDTQKISNSLAATGNSLFGMTQKPSSAKRTGTGKSSSAVMAKTETAPKPKRGGPVIIDGSRD